MSENVVSADPRDTSPRDANVGLNGSDDRSSVQGGADPRGSELLEFEFKLAAVDERLGGECIGEERATLLGLREHLVHMIDIQRPRIYFIECREARAVKIGFAIAPRERLRAIQACCPFELRIIALAWGGLPEEQRLHRLFSKYRIHGEWFRLEGEVEALARKLNRDARAISGLEPSPLELNARQRRRISRAESVRRSTGSRSIECNGRKQTLIQWAAENRIPVATIRARLDRGWPAERAVTEPSRPQERKSRRAA